MRTESTSLRIDPSNISDIIDPRTRVCNVKHGIEKTSVLAFPGLDDLPELNEVFDSCGRPRIVWDGDIDVFGSSLDELRHRVVKRLSPLSGNLVRKSLDNGHTWGFNDHTRENHVRFVTDRALNYLRFADATDSDFREAIIIGEAHDIGNVLSRSKHPIVSNWLLNYRIPEILDLDKFSRRIRTGIFFHDEKNSSALIDHYWNHNESDDPELIYDSLKQKLGRAGLAVLLADKTDSNDRRRVPVKNMGREAISADGFIETSLLSRLQRADVNGGRFEWQIKFDHLFDANEGNVPTCYGQSTQYHNSQRVWVSDQMQNAYRKEGIPYFFTWHNQILTSDYKRIRSAAYAAFSLFDGSGTSSKIDKFELDFYDTNGMPERIGFGLSHTIYRDNPEEGLRSVQSLGAFPNYGDQACSSVIREWQEEGRIEEFISCAESHFYNHPDAYEYLEEKALTIDSQGRCLSKMVFRVTPETIDQFTKHLRLIFNKNNSRH